MTGFELNERLGKVHFWVMFIAFNSTFGPLLVIGFLGMPRRVVTYAGYLQGANDWVSVSAFVLGASMLIFIANLVWSQVFVRTPRRLEPVGLEVDRVPAPVAGPRARLRPHPDLRSRPVSLRRRGRRLRRPPPGDLTREANCVSELAQHHTDYGVVEREPASTVERNLAIGSRLWASALVFFFFAFLFAYFYLRSLNEHGLFKPKGVGRSAGVGDRDRRLPRRERGASPPGRRRPARRPSAGVAVEGRGGARARARRGRRCRSSRGRVSASGRRTAATRRVYLGWTGLYTIFVFCTLYWLETCLALSYRYRGEPFGEAEVEPGHASGDAYRDEPDIANPVHLNTAEVAALTFTWWTLVAIGVATWFVLYVI